MNNFISEWYAIKTKSRHELKVYENLITKEINAFYPTIEVWSRRKDRKKKIRTSLFPGYLFVNCVLTDDNWYAINNTRGVASLIGSLDRAISIPQGQIDSIQVLLESGLPVTPSPYLKEGESVVVIDGPLKGATGIYIRADQEKGKLIVNVDILGRAVVVDIEPHFVEKD
ncbi:MAG: transcription termination/antitermination protein NusG [Candidatus Anammoxibacter sp.]